MKVTLFTTILNMSFTASIIILIVCIFRKLLTHAPKIFSYALWAVVLFRLLCPFSIETSFSIVPESVADGEHILSFSNTHTNDSKIFKEDSQEYTAAVLQGMSPIITYDETDNSYSSYVITASDGISEPSTVYDTWFPILSNLWLAGAIVLFAYSLIMFIRLRLKLISAIPIDDNIYIADHIDTPFVIGILQPNIYLPSSLAEKEYRYILLHEQHHIKRHDYILKILAFLALCIHWFNPLVWLAFILACRDMEMSCDEAVLKKLGTVIKEDYSSSLLSLATGRRMISGTFLAFGEGDTKERIKNALRWKKPALWIVLATTALCIVITILCFVNPIDNSIKSPYDWTSSVTTETIDTCYAILCDEDIIGINIKEEEDLLADFVYILNDMGPYAASETVQSISEPEVTIIIETNNKTYTLKYKNETTEFLFDSTQKSWQTQDEQLFAFMKKLLALGDNIKEEPETIPSVQEVSAMREKVLAGMTGEEIELLRELIKSENLRMESDYIYRNHFEEYKDPESPYWNLFTQSGDVHLAWLATCDAPGFDPNGQLTEEEYYALYGEELIAENNIPQAEVFYEKIDRLRNLVKTGLLDADFDNLENYMKLAVETRDVNYLYQIYYIFHDMDYFLLRYGPVDVGIYTQDDSTVSKYYSILEVYQHEKER